MSRFINSRLKMQFHITGRCNLSCKHCYREDGNAEPLSFDDVKMVIQQYILLYDNYNKMHDIACRGHINLTGGEPFIRADIDDILMYMGKHRDSFTYGILSNGSFISKERIELLKETHVAYVQLSIDGDRSTHDSLRAQGDYDRVLHTADILEQAGIRTMISFTANRQNYSSLPAVAKACRKHSISKLWSDRMVPIGKGAELTDLMITPHIMPDYLRAFGKARGNRIVRFMNRKTEVAMDRALQFLGNPNCYYHCSAGNSLIVVDEYGRIMPCRRLPIICGDVFTSTLLETYLKNPIFLDLRELSLPEECMSCKHSLMCRGGAKCMSYAVYDTYKRADPACPICGKF